MFQRFIEKNVGVYYTFKNMRNRSENIFKLFAANYKNWQNIIP